MFPINRILEYCSTELKVFTPKFHIKKMKLGIAAYCPVTEKIFLNVVLFRRLSKNRIDAHGEIVKYNFKNYNEYRFFVLAHEFAHHFQSVKYYKWQNRAYKNYLRFRLLKEPPDLIAYNEQKLERNANKIALILLSKSKKDSIFLDLYSNI